MYIHSTTILHYNSREREKEYKEGGGETVGELWLRTFVFVFGGETRNQRSLTHPKLAGRRKLSPPFHITRAFINLYQTTECVTYYTIEPNRDRSHPRATFCYFGRRGERERERERERLWLITRTAWRWLALSLFSCCVCAGWIYSTRDGEKIRTATTDGPQRAAKRALAKCEKKKKKKKKKKKSWPAFFEVLTRWTDKLDDGDMVVFFWQRFGVHQQQ